MFCTKCGRELNPRDRFCAHCGAEVTQSQVEQGKYDNVVFNPPFRMEAEKKTAQILKNRDDFRGFKELADESNKRTARSKGKMDWNLEGFPDSLNAGNNKSNFDWGSVMERRKTGRSFGYEKLDMTSTMEHKKIDSEEIENAAPAKKEEKISLGLPPEDTRIISLEELEKELYDLEEELRTDTARTAKYEPFKLEDIDNSDELDAYLDGISKTKKTPEKEEPKPEPAPKGTPMRWNFDEDSKAGLGQKAASSMGLVWGIDAKDIASKKKTGKAAAQKEVRMIWDLEAKEKEEKAKAEEKARQEAERARLEAERLEAERLEAERLEAERLEAERLEAERLEAERIEKERLEAKRAMAARLEAERLEAERLEAERAEAARLEAERLEAERLEAERLEAERLEAERAEAARLEAERLEAERLEAERAEAARLEAERLEAERLEAERAEAERAEGVSEDVAEEYDFLVKNSEPEYLEKTKIFDQNALEKAMLASEVAGITEEPAIEDLGMKKPLYQSDFRHPWDEAVEAVETAEEVVEEVAGEVTEEVAEAVETVEEAVEEPIEAAEEIVEEVTEEPAEAVEEVVETAEEAVEEVIEEPAETAEEVTEEVAEEAAEAVESAEEAAEEVIEEPVEAVEEAAEEVAEEAAEAVETAEEVVEEVIEEPVEAVEEVVETAEEAAEEVAEEVTEEAAEAVETVEEAAEEVTEEVTEAVAEEQAPEPEDEGETPEEEDRPAFYTFSKKNEAFQALLMKERERLQSMGADYVPQNEASKVNVSLIKDSTTPDAPAYEEDGHFVEGIVQPITTVYADLSGDPKPNADSLKTRFLSDNDWLREMTSQHDASPANKTKLRYSDLFPNPVLEDKFEGTGAFKEKTEEEKAEIAADINKIFDEDEATKPKSHIIGNTIIILLIILILFIGSVLAAKLFAPDSEYAHVTDGIIEKVFDYFSKDDATEPTNNTDVDIDTSEKESDATYFQGVVSSLSKDITDMGEIVYQDDLKYSDIMEPAFADVAGADPFIDEDWYEDENGTKVTYAEAIYNEVIIYYINWQQDNDDDNFAGIDKLELGEIKNVGDNYYTLVRLTYSNKDGGTETVTQTCYLTANDDNSMFIEEIKEETING